MIEREQTKSRILARRWWQVLFALLLSTILVMEAAPQVSANALYLLTDGISTVATGVERVSADRIVLTGAQGGETDVVLEADRKVAIHYGDNLLYATSRKDENVSALLQREGIALEPLEMVRVDLSDPAMIRLEIAADFTYYETVQEAASYTTVYTADYTIPKGETRVTTPGVAGTQDVTYEVVYADGAFVSRQAVAETNNTSSAEVVSTGTLVKTAQDGDTIAQVIKNDDGSGYLIMKSGDSLHFTHTMEVKCTAYTANVGKVGTITATGTKVHTGVVAVDRSVIPLGSTMFITTANGDYTYGMAHAEDTGVRGKVVDLYMNSYSECMQFGRRSSVLYFLDQ